MNMINTIPLIQSEADENPIHGQVEENRTSNCHVHADSHHNSSVSHSAEIHSIRLETKFGRILPLT